MPFRAGDVIADYEILEVLGQGGMGAVYRVRNRLTDRQEAMKQVLPHMAENPEAADRFLREIRIQASLHHPNIAALHTAMHVEQGIFMIMELVDGHSVEAMLRGGPLPLDQAIRIADDVLGALMYAHGRGVVHRDIKPANILITSRGMPKLTDFGIARGSGKQTITRSGVTLGSVHYMSPEQVMSQPADERSDLYSLGVTLYEMLTGARPFDGESEYTIMSAHVSRAPRAPNEMVPAIPMEISNVILRALAKAPQDRFQTAAEFQAALREALLGGAAKSELPPLLSQDEIARAEAALSEIMGPIAKTLVGRQSGQRLPLAEFCRRLADQIPNEIDRARFLRTAGMGSPAAAAPPTGTGNKIDEAKIAAARRALAVYLGPIAAVVVSRAAKEARSMDDFLAAMSREIANERDRQAFLKSCPR
ncbi:MAG TPA: serine/threonine-protein kinase [Bryobacteraceae bacterium]|jgi:serine/threonine protein kinase|nr:serine/threonine-protein kinase [Bryobacteraceae bacterium]